MSNTIDESQTKQLIGYLLGENGPLNLLKIEHTDEDALKFAENEKIVGITKKYLEDLTACWDDVHGKMRVLPYSFPNKDDLPSISRGEGPISFAHSEENNNPKTDDSVEQIILNSPGNPETESENNVSGNITNEELYPKPGGIPQNTEHQVTVLPKISFSLPNAKVGELYSSEIQVQGETEQRRVVIEKIDLQENTGHFNINPVSRKITGIPTKDGDCKVIVHFRFEDPRVEHPKSLCSEFNLFINPDPKSLWQKNEPDPNSPYIKKHEDKSLINGGDDIVMVAASRRGRSHEHSGSFRDDDFLLASVHGWNILAVADGAGSAKYSRKGSEIAVHKSIEYLKNTLAIKGEKIEQEAEAWFAKRGGQVKTALYETFGTAAYEALKTIVEEANTMEDAKVKDYSTTLLLAGHKRLSIGHFFAAYWVGDGGVGVYEKGKRIQLLGEVDSGEFAGQTRFLDGQVMKEAKDITNRLRFEITDDFTSLVLMTDGVTDPKFETDNNLASLQKWDEFWNEIEPILADQDTVSDKLLEWLEFWSPGNHDDRTIALLYK